MAKERKKKNEELEYDEEFEEVGKKGKKKGKGPIIAILIIAIIVGSSVAIIGFNVGGIRDEYLRPALDNVPIIGGLLPPLEDEEEIAEENENASQNLGERENLMLEIEKLEAEITRLEEFEKMQVQFKQEKAEFDQMIALDDPSVYQSFYETISPENAELLYKQVVTEDVMSKDFKEYISTFENMKKEAATKILEELITTDMDLVIEILDNLTSEKRGEILATMEPKNAASCTKLLSPN